MRIFCFGEILLRLAPPTTTEWIEKAMMPVFIGGAELNVATALAEWGMEVDYCTALPENFIAKAIVATLEKKKIDTSKLFYTGDKIGIYFLPEGTDIKAGEVVYDRAGSSFSQLKSNAINWNTALAGMDWLHFSAINPALNDNIAQLCREALSAAREKNLQVSLDLNFRSKLWKKGRNPQEIIPKMLPYCTVLMGNLWAVEALVGISSEIKDSVGKSKETLIDAAQKSINQVQMQYPNLDCIAYTFRLQNSYFAVLKKKDKYFVSKTFGLENIINKVGSGDCFMGALIYGITHQLDPQIIIDFAAAAAVGKMYEKGDATQQTITSIMKKIEQ